MQAAHIDMIANISQLIAHIDIDKSDNDSPDTVFPNTVLSL